MYAVFSSGGKQYRVEPGTTLVLERLTAEPGSAVTFDRVLLVGDGEQVTVGTPLVVGATVSATIVAQERGPKLVIYKFKQKVKYRRRTGHRQQLTRVRIDAINADGAGGAGGADGAGSTAEEPAAAKPRPRNRARAAKAPASGSVKAPASVRAKAARPKNAAEE